MDDKFKTLAKYNFWDGNIPELGYLRKSYTDNIFNYTGNKLVKVLVGQRRVGKSYLLRQIAKRLIDEGTDPNNILYINKEYQSPISSTSSKAINAVPPTKPFQTTSDLLPILFWHIKSKGTISKERKPSPEMPNTILMTFRSGISFIPDLAMA